MRGCDEDEKTLVLQLGETGMRLAGGRPGARLRHGNLLLLLERWEEAIEVLEPLESDHPDAVANMLEMARQRKADTRGE